MILAHLRGNLTPAEMQFVQFANNQYGRRRRWTWWFVGNMEVLHVLSCVEKALTHPSLTRGGRQAGMLVRWKIQNELGSIDVQVRKRVVDTYCPPQMKMPPKKKVKPWWQKRRGD